MSSRHTFHRSLVSVLVSACLSCAQTSTVSAPGQPARESPPRTWDALFTRLPNTHLPAHIADRPQIQLTPRDLLDRVPHAYQRAFQPWGVTSGPAASVAGSGGRSGLSRGVCDPCVDIRCDLRRGGGDLVLLAQRFTDLMVLQRREHLPQAPRDDALEAEGPLNHHRHWKGFVANMKRPELAGEKDSRYLR